MFLHCIVSYSLVLTLQIVFMQNHFLLSRNDMESIGDEWDQRGCHLRKDLSNPSQSVCECNHLTHFAILLSPGAVFSETHILALRTIGYMGVSISLVALIATILILSCLK